MVERVVRMIEAANEKPRVKAGRIISRRLASGPSKNGTC